MRNDRATSLEVWAVLKEFSDEDHLLTMGDIRRRLRQDYGAELDRRTVTAAIKTLQEFGCDISDYSENGVGYYVRERTFEPSELRLLMDAIYSFRGIPAKQTRDLIEKIQGDMSVHQRKRYTNLRVVKPKFKTVNRQVFYNIDQLDQAITEKRKVRFTYNKYDFDKKLKPTTEKPFVVDPYLLLAANGYYYLICNHSYFNRISHFRLDRMTDVEQLEEHALAPPKGVEFKEYIEKASAIYFGEEEPFTFRCRKEILRDVIDRFGPEVKIYNITEGTFDFTQRMVDKVGLFFALEYISRTEILSPEHARERMRRYVNDGMERYCK